MPSLFGGAVTDSKLSGLFSTNSRPVKQSKKKQIISDANGKYDQSEDSDEDSSAASVEFEDQSESQKESSSISGEDEPTSAVPQDIQNGNGATNESRAIRRKRKRDNEDLEALYMQRLAEDDAKQAERRRSEYQEKRQKQILTEESDLPRTGGTVSDNAEDDADETFDIPKHETLENNEGIVDIEQASRTIFIANVATSAITNKADKRTLLEHLSSFLSDLPESKPPHKIESTRFRSTAFSSKIPKKAAFARQEIMDATSKSTHMYAVYSTKQAAKEAAKRLNGTIVLDRHIRVDQVAHPAKVDHRRCIFVGNLGFVDNESQARANQAIETEQKPRKAQNGDVEEGLWRCFGKAGTVESGRVVRDPKTRVGKGFAYVQFIDENAVEAALLYNDKKFPPLIPRKMRVVRAKKINRNDAKASDRPKMNGAEKIRKNADNPNMQTLGGRAGKMLGRAGAANMRKNDDRRSKGRKEGLKSPEAIVFEGYRASSKHSDTKRILGKTRKAKKSGKPASRSATRGALWKKSKRLGRTPT